ncbi:MAG: HAMP domain-containing sensor histidine kinase, partial [Chitinophagaceae bacterium]
NLDIKTNAAFRQTILKLQSSKLKLEKISVLDTASTSDIVVSARRSPARRDKWTIQRKEPPITLMNLIQEKMRDSLGTGDSGSIRIFSMGTQTPFPPAYLDSLKQMAGRLGARSVNITTSVSTHMDSLDPNLIRDVKVMKAQRPSDPDVVVVGYGKRPAGIKMDSIRLHAGNRVPDKPQAQPDIEKITLVKEQAAEPRKNAVFRLLYNVDSLYMKDTVTVNEVSTAFASRLKEDRIGVGFAVTRLDSTQANAPNAVTIGFTQPATFGFSLENTLSYMFGKLKLPVLFSLLLVGLTIASFVLLYRNMLRQKRLADLKNEFISNITHELKTPIATVGVAIEALKNFNAMHDPARTREYLDISQNELQRLNLLVDKVLKLSVFEKKAIELKKEMFDFRQLTEEIMNSMRLQFEKYRAQVSLHTEGGQFAIEADKLHITSVVYNLLDNALKYSPENPVIDVWLRSHPQHLELSVQDKGLGIPAEYRQKVFDKFFRVPTGDRHNIKGYGLGLSYVAAVVRHHKGTIAVESESGKGSTFTITLPFAEAQAG